MPPKRELLDEELDTAQEYARLHETFRHRIRRLRMSEEQRDAMRQRDKQRKARQRAAQTPEQAAKQRQLDAMYRAKKRQAQTPEQAARQRQLDAMYRARQRQMQTPEQAARQRQLDTQRKAQQRASMTPEQAAKKRQWNAQCRAKLRQQQTPEEAARQRQLDAMYHAKKRQGQTPEQAAKQRQLNAIYRSKKRQGQTPEQAAKQRQLDAIYRSKKRQAHTSEQAALQKRMDAIYRATKRSQNLERAAQQRQLWDARYCTNDTLEPYDERVQPHTCGYMNVCELYGQEDLVQEESNGDYSHCYEKGDPCVENEVHSPDEVLTLNLECTGDLEPCTREEQFPKVLSSSRPTTAPPANVSQDIISSKSQEPAPTTTESIKLVIPKDLLPGQLKIIKNPAAPNGKMQIEFIKFPQAPTNEANLTAANSEMPLSKLPLSDLSEGDLECVDSILPDRCQESETVIKVEPPEQSSYYKEPTYMDIIGIESPTEEHDFGTAENIETSIESDSPFWKFQQSALNDVKTESPDDVSSIDVH